MGGDSPVEEFYRDKVSLIHIWRRTCHWFFLQVVFITGGTGFIGKVLLEKLLRSHFLSKSSFVGSNTLFLSVIHWYSLLTWTGAQCSNVSGILDSCSYCSYILMSISPFVTQEYDSPPHYVPSFPGILLASMFLNVPSRIQEYCRTHSVPTYPGQKIIYLLMLKYQEYLRPHSFPTYPGKAWSFSCFQARLTTILPTVWHCESTGEEFFMWKHRWIVFLFLMMLFLLF